MSCVSPAARSLRVRRFGALASAWAQGALLTCTGRLRGLTCTCSGPIGSRAGAGRVEDAACLRAPPSGPKVDEVLHQLSAGGDVGGAQRSCLRPNACTDNSVSHMLLVVGNTLSPDCCQIGRIRALASNCVLQGDLHQGCRGRARRSLLVQCLQHVPLMSSLSCSLASWDCRS